MQTATARRPRRKRPHNLHHCANVEALVTELRNHDIDLVSLISEFVKPSIDAGILVTGTIPWRLATAVSDVDVLILLPGIDAFKTSRKRDISGAPVKYWPSRSPNRVGISLFLSAIEFDLDFVINPAIGGDHDSARTAASRQDEHASNNLFMASLATGWIVHGRSVVEQWRAYYGCAEMRIKWMATGFAAGTKNLEDMEEGIGLATGHVSAIGADIVVHLLRALLAYNGCYCPSLKYLLGIDRLLDTVDQEMRDLLMTGRALAFPGLLDGVEAETAYFNAVLDFTARVQNVLSRDDSMAELLASLSYDLDVILAPPQTGTSTIESAHGAG